MPKPVKNALIYCRAASASQHESDPLAGQEEQCRAWAQAMGYTVRQVYKDAGYSGMSMQRPSLQSMITALITSTTPCAVIVADRARLTRNLNDWPNILGTFDDLKAELLVVEELPIAQSA